MKVVQIILAVALFLCLAKMPYGYYKLVSLFATVVFLVMAFQYWVKKHTPLTIVCGGLALLFQPFCRISLGRAMWNTVDIIVAFFLVGLCLWEMTNKEDKEEDSK